MKMSLKDAQVEPEQIDYVNPHATSTPTGDRNEAAALLKIFNSGRSLPVVSATKSMTGHLLGAAGAVEAIFVCLSLLRGPHTAHYQCHKCGSALCRTESGARGCLGHTVEICFIQFLWIRRDQCQPGL